MVVRNVHGCAEFGGSLFPAAAAKFPAPPLPGFEQGRFVEPGRKRVIAAKLPGLASQHSEHVLRNFLGATRVLDLSQSRRINQVEMTPDKFSKRLLAAVSREILEQFKIASSLAHVCL